MSRYLWLVLLIGCKAPEPHPLDALLVERAELHDWTLSSFAVFGGALSGDADLVVFPRGQAPLHMPVRMRGGTFGLALDFQLVGGPLKPVPFQLPEEQVPASHLLGKYRGGGQSVGVVLGFDNHHLRNRDDVVLDATLLSGGLSVSVAAEWLRIEQDGPLEPVEDSLDDTGLADTGLR